MTVGVIGAGLGGLGAACTLAARGHRVTIFDQNTWSGGKAAVWEERGFRFDMGPTILTVPSVLRRIFAEANRDLDDYLDLIRIDPQWRSFFHDGSTLDLVADENSMTQALGEFGADERTTVGYRKFLELAAAQHRISEKWFFYRPIGGLRDMFDARQMTEAGTLHDLRAMRLGRTFGGTVRSFLRDKRVAQMVDHFAQYLGSAPDQSPAILCGVAHMQTSEGIWYPRGGTGAIPAALEKLAVELGVEFRLGETVREIRREYKTVRGLELESGECFDFDAIVSNSDSVRTHRELLGGVRSFDRRRKYEPACSGVVLYLGLRRRCPELLHHNFVFSRDPHEEFDSIYRRGDPAPDPTCYVCAPSVSDPNVAPSGGEALYILVHTPSLRPRHDWREMFPRYRRVILDKMKSTTGVDLEKEIVVERALTPQDIHERYRVLNGAIYGIASHGRLTGAFKPNNRSPDFRNLYLCGGAAHPGPGMPMVLMSGWIAADALDQDFRSALTPPQELEVA